MQWCTRLAWLQLLFLMLILFEGRHLNVLSRLDWSKRFFTSNNSKKCFQTIIHSIQFNSIYQIVYRLIENTSKCNKKLFIHLKVTIETGEVYKLRSIQKDVINSKNVHDIPTNLFCLIEFSDFKLLFYFPLI